jgi:ABC-type antimicrobial peptide transport system permease subunit
VGARSYDWGLLALTAFGLLAAAAIGAFLPARRASLVDPNIVLRQG